MGVTRDSAEGFLTFLYVCAFIVAILFIALVSTLMVLAVKGRIEDIVSDRRDRRSWQQIDEEAKALRAELDDDAALALWAGRAA